MINFEKRLTNLEQSILGNLATEQEDEEALKELASFLSNLDEKYIVFGEVSQYSRIRMVSSYDEILALRNQNKTPCPILEWFDFECVDDVRQYCRGLSTDIQEGRIQDYNEALKRLPQSVLRGIAQMEPDANDDCWDRRR